MSDGDLHDTITLVFHGVYFLIALTLVVVILAITANVVRNASAPIPEVLVQDILAEQIKTCLAPENELFATPEIGYLDEAKLTQSHLSSCIEQDTKNFMGIQLTDTISGEINRIAFTTGGFKEKAGPYFVTIKHIDGSYTAATMEVLFR